MSTQVTVVDNGDVVAKGSYFAFEHTLTRNEATWDLTNATVTATLRKESDPSTEVDPDLEDMTVIKGNDSTTAAEGGVSLEILSAVSANLYAPPGDALTAIPYLLQYKVVESGETDYPQPFRIYVRSVID